jgi:U3 small nucleolar RNA-associated protein 12
LELSGDGGKVYTTGQDRSLRVWSRTDDLVFVEEERERALDAQVDQTVEKERAGDREGEAVVAALGSAESARGGELLMQAIDLVESELVIAMEQRETERIAKEKETQDKEEPKKKKVRKSEQNPMLLGLTPIQYLQRALRMIKGPDLEPALLVLPFHYVKRLIALLVQMAKSGLDIELCCRCGVFLLLCHQKQISATSTLLPELLALKEVLGGSVHAYRELIGTNNAGLQFVQRVIENESDEKMALEDLIQTGDKIGNAHKSK